MFGLSRSIAWMLLKMVSPTGVSCSHNYWQEGAGSWGQSAGGRLAIGCNQWARCGVGGGAASPSSSATYLVDFELIGDILELGRVVVDV